MSPHDFTTHLREHGFDFFTGVPCSLVKGFIAQLEAEGAWIPETREDAALGLAAGAYLGGRQPVVIMQNSGLGVSINALASLHLIYQLPCLLIVTWRGYGKDAPEHVIMGGVCETLMDTIGLLHRAPAAGELPEALVWAADVVRRRRLPAALLLRKGVVE
jgi:phosphonopyruvate decarboxylase